MFQRYNHDIDQSTYIAQLGNKVLDIIFPLLLASRVEAQIPGTICLRHRNAGYATLLLPRRPLLKSVFHPSIPQSILRTFAELSNCSLFLRCSVIPYLFGFHDVIVY